MPHLLSISILAACGFVRLLKTKTQGLEHYDEQVNWLTAQLNPKTSSMSSKDDLEPNVKI